MTVFHRAFRPVMGLVAAGLTLAGCMQPTSYGPRMEGSRTGYTDRALTENRYRVTFTGNTVTPRETVESYLLLRSAEVARAAGYQFFVFDTRNTRARTTYQAVPMMPPPDPWWGYRRGFGYWGGYGFAYDPGVDIVTRTNFQAYAEIVLLTPEQARTEPRAVRADDVIARIGPEAVKPPPGGVPPA